jgi:acetylornithine/succinyldiaminopimelate/putrescine aminotransferase
MSNQAALGTVFPAPSELQAELAERIVGRVTSVEKVRFANSGTEAVMMAVRGARAFTEREKDNQGERWLQRHVEASAGLLASDSDSLRSCNA